MLNDIIVWILRKNQMYPTKCILSLAVVDLTLTLILAIPLYGFKSGYTQTTRKCTERKKPSNKQIVDINLPRNKQTCTFFDVKQ